VEGGWPASRGQDGGGAPVVVGVTGDGTPVVVVVGDGTPVVVVAVVVVEVLPGDRTPVVEWPEGPRPPTCKQQAGERPVVLVSLPRPRLPSRTWR